MSPAAPGERPKRSLLRRLLAPRVLVSLAVTGVALWFALRDLDFREVGQAIARARLVPLIAISVPAHLLNLLLRALRWRYLTDPVKPIDRSTLFRGQAVGFMGNNVFPLRVGEVLRAWYVARETGAPGAALLGTVILERVIDAVAMLGLVALVLGLGGAAAAGLEVRTVLMPLLLLALAPLLFVVVLRVWPDGLISLATRLLGSVLSPATTERLSTSLRHLADGLRGLRGGTALAWVALHSLLQWFVVSVVPFGATLWSLGIDLGSPERLVLASYALLMWVGAAVAIPSAPGFFGPYHAACWVALAPFGVSKELAIALGTLAHGVFWLTTTTAGLLVLRTRATPLPDLDAIAPE
jgi:glycosyltransferase 2 family protein